MPTAQVIPNAISYNATISSCEKGSQWQVACQLFESMPHAGCTPDVISYSAAITACDRAALWQDGLQLFDNLTSAKITPNVISYSALAACWFRWAGFLNFAGPCKVGIVDSYFVKQLE